MPAKVMLFAEEAIFALPEIVTLPLESTTMSVERSTGVPVVRVPDEEVTQSKFPLESNFMTMES